MAAGDATSVFLQYGVLGVVALALGTFAWRTIQRERERADRLEQQLADVNARITDRLAEVVSAAAVALKDANDYLRDLARRRT